MTFSSCAVLNLYLRRISLIVFECASSPSLSASAFLTLFLPDRRTLGSPSFSFFPSRCLLLLLLVLILVIVTVFIQTKTQNVQPTHPAYCRGVCPRVMCVFQAFCRQCVWTQLRLAFLWDEKGSSEYSYLALTEKLYRVQMYKLYTVSCRQSSIFVVYKSTFLQWSVWNRQLAMDVRISVRICNLLTVDLANRQKKKKKKKKFWYNLQPSLLGFSLFSSPVTIDLYWYVWLVHR